MLTFVGQQQAIRPDHTSPQPHEANGGLDLLESDLMGIETAALEIVSESPEASGIDGIGPHGGGSIVQDRPLEDLDLGDKVGGIRKGALTHDHRTRIKAIFEENCRTRRTQTEADP